MSAYRKLTLCPTNCDVVPPVPSTASTKKRRFRAPPLSSPPPEVPEPRPKKKPTVVTPASKSRSTTIIRRKVVPDAWAPQNFPPANSYTHTKSKHSKMCVCRFCRTSLLDDWFENCGDPDVVAFVGNLLGVGARSVKDMRLEIKSRLETLQLARNTTAPMYDPSLMN